MARAQTTDFYHVMKYAIRIVTGGITGASDFQAGFNTASIPEINIEIAEYKEGVYLHRRKFPGDVTYSDLTLTKGVAKKNTAMFDWINATKNGEEYRVDLQIAHFHRDDVVGLADFTTATPNRIINCFECTPMRVKPGSDMDALSSEVSIEEMDITLERMELSDSN